MANEPSKAIKIAHGVVETAAILVGLVLFMVSLMAIIGLFTDNLWARVIPSAIITIALPILITDRLLPESDEIDAGRGIFTDVAAITWFGVGMLIIVVATPYTHSMIEAEADRLDEEGITVISGPIAWMIGDPPVTTSAIDEETTEPQEPADAGHIEADVDVPDTSHADVALEEHPEEPEEHAETEPDTGEMTPVEIFRELSPAVVSIKIQSGTEDPYGRGGGGSGTGFIIDSDGTIITNEHVISGGKSIEIALHDGTTFTEVMLLAEDARLDLAVLRIDTDKELKTTTLADSDLIEVGERVVAIGNPLGLDYTMTDGLISARRVWRDRNMIQISAPLSPGNSGGPLFNMRGEVIGVNTAALGNAFNRGENLNLAVPTNELKDNVLKSDYPDAREFGTQRSARSSW